MKSGNVTTEMIIQKTKKNIHQLLIVGIYNTDESIKRVYGGEGGLLNLIKGYFCLLEDLQAFKNREEKENEHDL